MISRGTIAADEAQFFLLTGHGALLRFLRVHSLAHVKHVVAVVHAHLAVGAVRLVVEVGRGEATYCVVIHVGRIEIHVVV